MNIAIFGGSFDPPHLGHQAIIKEVLKSLKIDKLIIVPAFLNPFKYHSSFDPKVRYELIKELCQDLEQVEVSDYEIKQNKATPTIQTIKYIKNKYKNCKNIYLIIGADNLKKLHLWEEYNELKQLVKFVVASRDNIKTDEFITLKVDFNISSTKIRENLDITLIPNKIKEKVKKLWKIE
ncbi:MAG: nicotinate (nicotinamide) nucleotide adenylyltransferase [Arcobacteraceae bacterium]|nr:nicotinate (nicotinamide) nucleotide adenylyltransferase [Arcobacteraceae bacterium]